MATFQKTVTALLAAGAVVASLGVASTAAHAVVPSNDTYAGRVSLEVPTTVTLDTTEATTGTRDQVLNEQCGAPAVDASVWYRLGSDEGSHVVVDASASDYSVGLIVAHRSGRSWVLDSCGPEVVSLFLEPGLGYAVLAFDYQDDGGGNGGTLVLTTYVPTRRVTMTATVDEVGEVDARAGTAVVSGTLTCRGAAVLAGVEVLLTQRAGRVLITGYGGSYFGCNNQTRAWHAQISDADGLFRGGSADAAVWAFAYGLRTWSEQTVERTVKLR